MRQEFNKIEIGNRILLSLSNESKNMELGATIAKHLKDNIALIILDTNDEQISKFDDLKINTVYTNPDGIPYIWENTTIVYYQGQYLLQVKSDFGQRHICRNSVRVGVSHYAELKIAGQIEAEVVIGDISLTGFSIIDSQKELELSQGTHAFLRYEDIGYKLELEGNLVRTEETEESIIYGFVITKCSRELSSYVNQKQKKS